MKILLNVYTPLEELVGKAARAGYKREDPRKAWTDKERMQAARWFLEHLIKAQLPSY